MDRIIGRTAENEKSGPDPGSGPGSDPEIPGDPYIYTVTFDSNGGSAVESQKNLGADRKAERPYPHPTRTNYHFIDWYISQDCTGTVYDFNAEVTSDFTLYAKWGDTGFTVNFNSNGSSDIESQTLGSGGRINRPPDPVKAFAPGLYLDTDLASLIDTLPFAGWFTEAAFINKWNFDTDTISANITLYAKWNGLIDVSKEDGDNSIEKAVAYVNKNATLGAFTLLAGADTTLKPQSLATNAQLTIRGFNPLVQKELILSPAHTGSLFSINGSAALTLDEGITLVGHNTNTLSLVGVMGINSMFTMNGGNITGNKAANGGAVYVEGTFIMNGGTISNNQAELGAGVYNSTGTFILINGNITGNTATVHGGGVFYTVDLPGAQPQSGKAFTIMGGEIAGNFAAHGGGVYVEHSVPLVGSSSPFTIGGSAKIDGNKRISGSEPSNVCLANNTYITLGSGANNTAVPESGMEIHVQTETPDGVIVECGATRDSVNYFLPDENGKVLFHTSGKLRIIDDPNTTADGESETTAFKLYNAESIKKIGVDPEWDLSKNYELIADIELDEDWKPIGKTNPNLMMEFKGTFSGGGFTIKGITINSSSSNQGFISYIGPAGTVKLLGLIDVNITGTDKIGGIAGLNEGTIENCFVSGSVTGTGIGKAGGIVGENESSGTIINSYTTAAILSSNAYINDFIGGIAGRNAGTIDNCVALNENVKLISNSNYIGRITGYLAAGSANNNFAWSGMQIENSGGPKTPVNNANDKDGMALTADEIKNYNGMNWPFSFDGNPWIWNGSEGGMPSLGDDETILPWPDYLN